MSVLIKGMKMPTRCDDCVMGHELAVGTSVTGYGCLAMLRMGDARIRPISCGTRPDWCPLVEVPTPHGRLIDADAYHKEIRERYQSAKEWYNEAEDDEIIGRAESAMITFTECSLTLQNMPTIIGAEEDE